MAKETGNTFAFSMGYNNC